MNSTLKALNPARCILVSMRRLLLLALIGLAACAPVTRVFGGHAQDFVLSAEDFPQAYVLVPEFSGEQSNARVIELRGEEEGKAYIEASNRLDGWVSIFERSSSDSVTPQYVLSHAILFESHAGALAALDPQWNREFARIKGGISDQLTSERLPPETSLIVRTVEAVERGDQIELAVYVVHHNLLLVVDGLGFSDEVQLDYMIDLMETQIAKIDGMEEEDS